jgi:cysteine desulfurase NifS
VNELTDLGNYDEISGFPVYKALLCEVTKVNEGKSRGPDVTVDEVVQQDTTDHEHQDYALPVFATPRPLFSGERIYLDNNATTRLAEEARVAMLEHMEDSEGNPSSLHASGRLARDAIEESRRRVARMIHARPRSVIFTGSGSESDNLALKGVVFAGSGRNGHVITSRIEHPAILETAAFLESVGCEVTYLDVDAEGLIDPDTLRVSLRPETLLVSVMLANNETGALQPIQELCAIAHEHDALFHTDAVQGAGRIPIDVEELDVDLLSLSGHKFHGPKGIGALYVRKGLPLEPLIHGGSQESNLRAGTHNVPAIVGMGVAAGLATRALGQMDRIRELRDRLEEGVSRLIPGAERNGHPTRRLPNTLNLTLPGIRGESLVVALDRHGVALSSGSACKAGSPDPTHVLLAMGRTTEQAHCSIRFSLSAHTTDGDVDTTLEALEAVLEEMENTIRFLPCK